jgi:type I restriction enzyme M protein
MTDLALLSQALLDAVPAQRSIGNQSLFEQFRAQFVELTEEQFWAARDALVEQTVLVKGRGRGGSVLRAQGSGASLADQVLNKARERFEPVVQAEASGTYIAEAAAAVRSPAKQQASSTRRVQAHCARADLPQVHLRQLCRPPRRA